MSETIETPVKHSFLTRAMLAAEAKKAELRAAKADETNTETPAPKRKIVKVVAAVTALSAAAYATYRLLNANEESSETESAESADTADTSTTEE